MTKLKWSRQNTPVKSWDSGIKNDYKAGINGLAVVNSTVNSGQHYTYN